MTEIEYAPKRLIDSHEPHFELTHHKTAGELENPTLVPTTARMHHGMISSHAFMQSGSKMHHSHSQISAAMSGVHPLTADEFAEQQQRQSEEWVRAYAAQLNQKGQFSAKFLFGSANQRIENPLSVSTTPAAILAEFGQ